MTEDLATRIMRHEGFTPHPKPDAKGMYVIGYGHDITAGEADNYPDGMTEPEARDLLDSDIAKFAIEVNRAFPWSNSLSPTRQGILIEMAFQLGIFSLYAFKDMLAALQAGDYASAAKAMLNSEWHYQTPGRCEELANLMLYDNQPEETTPWLTTT